MTNVEQAERSVLCGRLHSSEMSKCDVNLFFDHRSRQLNRYFGREDSVKENTRSRTLPSLILKTLRGQTSLISPCFIPWEWVYHEFCLKGCGAGALFFLQFISLRDSINDGLEFCFYQFIRAYLALITFCLCNS